MNEDLAVLCSSCGSFVQQKVDNINLFEMIWKVIETPRKAFHSIALARNKNYIIFLSCIGGIGFAFTLFWLVKIGEIVSELINLLVFGFTIGPIIGIIVVASYSFLVKLIYAVRKKTMSFRNIFAIVSYSLIPMILTVLFILPIEILSFGVFMFTKSPSAYSLKPFSYITIITIDGLCGLWTIMLLTVGLKTLSSERWFTTIVITLLSVIIFGSLILRIVSYVVPKISLMV